MDKNTLSRTTWECKYSYNLQLHARVLRKFGIRMYGSDILKIIRVSMGER